MSYLSLSRLKELINIQATKKKDPVKKPELVSPAGNLEKLKIAVLYGANAVYLSGERFGLRASADNFNNDEIIEGVEFAHARSCRVYVTLNALMHDEDLNGLEEYCEFLQAIDVDAVIVSDPGVLRLIKLHSSLPVHISTQASCLNGFSAKFWKGQGAQRIIVGRELSINEASRIQEVANIDTEMFVHGSMCMAYSGRCAISNYISGRDANRGGCIQSCRFGYLRGLRRGKNINGIEGGTLLHFLSSKDLFGLFLIPVFFEKKICALKIEGRMKSPLYVAAVTSAYRQAIDAYAKGTWNGELIEDLIDLLNYVPHRDYTEASLLRPAGIDSVYQGNKSTLLNTSKDMLGIVLESDDSKLLIRNYQSLHQGDDIEIISVDGERIRICVKSLKNVLGNSIQTIRQESLAILPPLKEATAFQILVKAASRAMSSSVSLGVQANAD